MLDSNNLLQALDRSGAGLETGYIEFSNLCVGLYLINSCLVKGSRVGTEFTESEVRLQVDNACVATTDGREVNGFNPPQVSTQVVEG